MLIFVSISVSASAYLLIAVLFHCERTKNVAEFKPRDNYTHTYIHILIVLMGMPMECGECYI